MFLSSGAFVCGAEYIDAFSICEYRVLEVVHGLGENVCREEYSLVGFYECKRLVETGEGVADGGARCYGCEFFCSYVYYVEDYSCRDIPYFWRSKYEYIYYKFYYSLP